MSFAAEFLPLKCKNTEIVYPQNRAFCLQTPRIEDVLRIEKYVND